MFKYEKEKSKMRDVLKATIRPEGVGVSSLITFCSKVLRPGLNLPSTAQETMRL